MHGTILISRDLVGFLQGVDIVKSLTVNSFGLCCVTCKYYDVIYCMYKYTIKIKLSLFM